jgi:KDO2-lipid IV(A) lauroyltransferase
MKEVIWRLQAALFYLFTLFVSALPRSQSFRIGRRIGLILFGLLASRRAIAIDNISKALPFMKNHPAWTGEFETAEEIARTTFINLGISIVEVCRLYHGKDDLINAIEVRGEENLEKAREKQRGMICISGHCGNWELMSLSFKRFFDVNVWAIARKLDNPHLNKIVETMRMGYGNQMIYNKSSLRQILSVIKSGGTIGMLADQAVFEDNGALIEFLGRKAWANKAPAIIAHKTGVPLLPVFLHRSAPADDRHVLTILPEYTLCGDRTEAGICRDVQMLACLLEAFICAHPTDWYWVHRRWKRAGEPI